MVRRSYDKRRHFENNFLAGNDHVVDIFTSEDVENIYYNECGCYTGCINEVYIWKNSRQSAWVFYHAYVHLALNLFGNLSC